MRLTFELFFCKLTFELFTARSNLHPNAFVFGWDLLSKGYQQFVQIVPCHWIRPSSPEPRKLWGIILVYSIVDWRSTKIVQIMVEGWSLTILQQGQICAPMYLYGENVKKSFSQNVLNTNGWNLQCMIKLLKLLALSCHPSALLKLPSAFSTPDIKPYILVNISWKLDQD